MASVSNKSIAIVGSGLSGLTAACLLHKLGFNVTVFEAAGRIGGRTFSVWDGRTQLALGAQWLHSGSSNPLYPLVKQLGLLDSEYWQRRQDNLADLCEQDVTYQYDWSQSAVVTDLGESVDCNLARRAEQTVRQHLAAAYELPDDLVHGCYGDRMGAFLDAKFSLDLQQEANTDLYSLAVRNFALFYANVEGLHSLNDLSIVGGSEYTCADGQCLVIGGLAAVAEALAARLPRDCVRLQNKVERISIASDGSASLLVNSQWLSFDHALVTVSLGVLQTGQLIDPSLVSAERQSALQQMRLGLVDKIYVRFSLPISLPNDCNHLWILKRKLYRSWLDGLTSVSVVNKSRDTVILWLAGSFAAEMERQTVEQLEATLMPFLQSVLGRQLPRVAKIWRTSFGQNPNFLGSYSSYRPGCKTGATGQLAKPIELPAADGAKKPIICFAGEHTSETNYATVQGAFLSGLREASRLAKYYQLDKAVDSDLVAML